MTFAVVLLSAVVLGLVVGGWLGISDVRRRLRGTRDPLDVAPRLKGLPDGASIDTRPMPDEEKIRGAFDDLLEHVDFPSEPEVIWTSRAGAQRLARLAGRPPFTEAELDAMTEGLGYRIRAWTIYRRESTPSLF